MLQKINNLKIKAFTNNGHGYGFYQGKCVYVNGSIPGETVDCKVFSKNGRTFHALMTQVIESSSSRIEPTCKHANLCGGCNWQHIKYEDQLKFKYQYIENELIKNGFESIAIKEYIPANLQEFKRNRLEYAFSDTRWFFENEDEIEGLANRAALGFFVKDRHSRVLNIEECSMQGDISGQIRDYLRNYFINNNIQFFNLKNFSGFPRNLIIRSSQNGHKMVILGVAYYDKQIIETLCNNLIIRFPQIVSLFYFINPDFDIQIADCEWINYGNTSHYIHDNLNGLTFSLSPKSFFQSSASMSEKLYNQILIDANAKSKDLIYDLYSGIGTIALHIAQKAGQVIGIEGNMEAVVNAQINASLNSINNARFIYGDVLETFTPQFIEQHGNPQIIILDPPRSGTLIETKKTILQSSAQKVIYVSCNISTLLRDLKQLSQGFNIEYIQPIDMFPQTHHIEVIAVLKRK